MKKIFLAFFLLSSIVFAANTIELTGEYAKDYQIYFQMQQPKQSWLAISKGYGWQSEDSLSCLL
jgi:hypothetical protein